MGEFDLSWERRQPRRTDQLAAAVRLCLCDASLQGLLFQAIKQLEMGPSQKLKQTHGTNYQLAS